MSFNFTSCGNNEETFLATFNFIRQWPPLRTAINNSHRIFVFAAKSDHALGCVSYLLYLLDSLIQNHETK